MERSHFSAIFFVLSIISWIIFSIFYPVFIIILIIHSLFLGIALYLLLANKRIRGLNEYYNPRPMGIGLSILEIILIPILVYCELKNFLFSFLPPINSLFSLVGGLILTKKYEKKILHEEISNRFKKFVQEIELKFKQLEFLTNQIKIKESELKSLETKNNQMNEIKREKKIILKKIRSLKKNLKSIKQSLNIKL